MGTSMISMGFTLKNDTSTKPLNLPAGVLLPKVTWAGGTGMICYEFKGGIGTSSRVLQVENESFTVGVLVQANCGRREQLLIAGVPVGREIPEHTFQEEGEPGAPSAG